jgi:putative membrane protein insertion efficiency factor
MVFIWGRRTRRGGYDGYGGRRYGYGPRGGGSCGRDLCLLEGGCCLAEAMGCGSQLGLVAPSMVRDSLRAAGRPVGSGDDGTGPCLRVLVTAIELYRSEISPRRPPCCRFEPTCSAYALAALHAYGLRRGGWLGLRRLARCRPGAVGGSDPVAAAAGVRRG